jgi:AraC-like DNA-binding protein
MSAHVLILSCLPRTLEVEFRRRAGGRVTLSSALDIDQVRDAIRSGAFPLVIVDPSTVTEAFLRELLDVVSRSASTLLVWSDMCVATYRALVEAGSSGRVEPLFRGIDDALNELPARLSGFAEQTVRGAILDELVGVVRVLPQSTGYAVASVLLGCVRPDSVETFAADLDMERRTLEHRLRGARLCTPRVLVRLGQLVVAYEQVRRGRASVTDAAHRAKFQTSRALWVTSRELLGRAPSDFVERLNPREFAQRIVAVLQATRSRGTAAQRVVPA